MLDFGLAKLTQEQTEVDSRMPTAQVQEEALTSPVTALGTVGYRYRNLWKGHSALHACEPSAAQEGL